MTLRWSGWTRPPHSRSSSSHPPPRLPHRLPRCSAQVHSHGVALNGEARCEATPLVDGPPSLTLSLRGAAAALLPAAAAGACLLPHHPWSLNPRWVRDLWRYGTRRGPSKRCCRGTPARCACTKRTCPGCTPSSQASRGRSGRVCAPRCAASGPRCCGPDSVSQAPAPVARATSARVGARTRSPRLWRCCAAG